MNPSRPSAEQGTDALPLLVAYVVVLVGVPSVLIVGPLGAAGTPAQILAIGMFVWWLGSRVITPQPPRRMNPVKWLVFGLAAAILASYVSGMTRPIAYIDEVRSADRSLLALCAWCGVVLIMSDGISTRARLLRLLRVVAGGVTFVAALGVLQFLFHIDLAAYIRPPGLVENHPFGVLSTRSDYQRVYGTTSHPIEFGVVLSCVLPLVIHYARFAADRTQRRWWWAAVAIVAIALPMSVSRSGALGGLIVLVFLLPTLAARARVQALGLLAVGAVAMSVVVPGLLGTIRGLFLNASSDPSTQGRTADYGPLYHYVTEHPLFGRGIGTFIPGIYRTLDNAYLGFVAETGIVGLLALVSLFVGSICVAGSIRRHSLSDEVRNLAQSLKAGLVVLAVNAATFDALGFSMCVGMIFLLVGGVGALWKLERGPRPQPAAGRVIGVRAMRVTAALLVVGLAAGALGVVRARPEYQAYGAVLLTSAPKPGEQSYATTPDTAFTASVLKDVMTSGEVRHVLRSRAPDYEVALQGGSLVQGTDVTGNLGSSLLLAASGPSAAAADGGLHAVFVEAERQLVTMQTRVGVPSKLLIHTSVLQKTPAGAVYGRPSRADAGLLLLAVLLIAGYLHLLRRQRRNSVPESKKAKKELRARELASA